MTRRAVELLGTPFVICGRDPNEGLDCIGMLYECCDAAGIDVRGTDVGTYSPTWWKMGQKQILLDGMRPYFSVVLTSVPPLVHAPGDWLLYSYDGTMVGHVAYHVGDGHIIHTFTEKWGGVIRAETRHRYWATRYIGWARLKREVIRGRQ